MNNFQFVGILRVAFLLVFIAVLVSCPIPDISTDASASVDAGGDAGDNTDTLTAEAGRSQAVIEETEVTLDGSESTVPTNDSIASYNWIFVESIPAGVGVSDLGNDTTTPGATFTAPAVAAFTRLTFRLTVTDTNGKSTSDEVTIVVVPTPPMANAGDDQRVSEVTAATLNATASRPASSGSPIVTYIWEQTLGPRVTWDNHDPRSANLVSRPRFTTPFVAKETYLEFRLVVISSNGATASDTVGVRVEPSSLVDADRDGLIEIDNLAMLHNMRYNLAGTSYDTDDDDSSGNAGSTTGDTGRADGCPGNICTGYELTQNLDFDTDGDGSSYTGSSPANFILDSGDNNATYFDIDAGGWKPIGTNGAGNAFTAVFEGNGHTIANLVIQYTAPVTGNPAGFFGAIGAGAIIRNIGLVDNLTVVKPSASGDPVGGLVGFQADGSTIVMSHTTGNVYSENNGDSLGALVGTSGGNILFSHATGNVNAELGQAVGALVGRQHDTGVVLSSSATGKVNGIAGVLLGEQNGSVVASAAIDTTSGASNSQ